ncbi:MAG: DUF1295 domain-containing protein [Actinobacteria bacterium]|nr:DUF1295 domain-containing protein [Actinomycetota bacterium]
MLGTAIQAVPEWTDIAAKGNWFQDPAPGARLNTIAITDNGNVIGTNSSQGIWRKSNPESVDWYSIPNVPKTYCFCVQSGPSHSHSLRLRTKSLYLVFMLQAVLAWFISLPLQVAIHSKTPVNAIDYLGLALWLIGITIQTTDPIKPAVLRGVGAPDYLYLVMPQRLTN